MLVVIDAQPRELGLPTRAYVAVEEVHDVSVLVNVSVLFSRLFFLIFFSSPQDGSPASKTFEHLSSEIGAEEAEEVF